MLAARLAIACSSEPPTGREVSGEALFSTKFTPEGGLGPLYNARSCVECHAAPAPGGVGTNGLSVVFRVGLLEGDRFDDLAGRGGPVSRGHSVSELGSSCRLAPGVPAEANVVSTRNTPALFGLGELASISDDTIAGGAGKGPVHGITGRPNWVIEDGERRVGRLGWKAQGASLERFVGEAVRTELGLTNTFFPGDLVTAHQARGCSGFSTLVEAEVDLVPKLHDFVANLPAVPPTDDASVRGREIFGLVGCAGCHTPSLPSDTRDVPLYSDLLLHDMGPALADGFVQGEAASSDWRTTPLWGLRLRSKYLHDGRASTLSEALTAHDGEAAETMAALAALPAGDQAELLAFLAGL